jgi:hypothetical protein
MNDEQNPDYIFSLTTTLLLLRIARGELNANDYVRKELVNRGIGRHGLWVGFPEAARQWLRSNVKKNQKKLLQLEMTHILDGWIVKSSDGLIDYLKLKNGLLVTIDNESLKIFDLDFIEVSHARVVFKKLITKGEASSSDEE